MISKETRATLDKAISEARGMGRDLTGGQIIDITLDTCMGALTREAICAIKIDGPTLLLVDANQVDMAQLSHWRMPNINQTVLVIPVDGTPSVLSLSLEALKEAVKKLEAA